MTISTFKREDVVRSTRDMTLSDDTVIPKGSHGVVVSVGDPFTGWRGRDYDTVWVEFDGYRNPNAPCKRIGCGPTELKLAKKETREREAQLRIQAILQENTKGFGRK